MNIRQKLIAILLAIALLPAIMVSIVAYTLLANDITNTKIKQLSSEGDDRYQKINDLLRAHQLEAQAIANNLALQNIIHEYLKSDRTNNTALKTGLQARLNQNIETIWITDMQANVLATTSSQNLSKLHYTELQPETKKPIFLATDEVTKLNSLFFVADTIINNQRMSMVVVEYPIDDIITVLQDYSGLGATGEVVVAEIKDGNAISLFPTRFDGEAALKAQLNGLHLNEQVDAVYSEAVDYRGEPVIAATKFLPLPNWNIGVKMDRSEALSAADVLRNSIIIIGVVTAIVILGVALFISNHFTRPIIDLTIIAQRIMAGELHRRTKVTRKDEIGILGNAFNRMADQLVAFNAELEGKVEQRTADLNQKVRQLGEAAAKDEALLGSIGDGLIVTDQSGTILLANAIAIELLRLPQKSVGTAINSYPLFDMTGKQISADKSPVQAALAGGEKVVQDVQIEKPDGAKVSLNITATPAILNGKVIGVIQLVRDVTREREVDRMKTEFISLSSHQLRTPLSAIKWFTEMLISGDAGKLNPEQAQFAQSVAQSTERMIELVNSLLNISRIESGRIIVAPRPTDMNELVQNVIADLNVKVVEKKQSLIVSVHHGLPKINLDPQLVGQVYLNLLSNAIKYTPEGGEIQLYVSSKDGQLVSQVSDNGYGIPASQHAKVFQRFFRAENITKVVADGTGLGLYLVKAIIESSGGKIWFESKEGKGTTFWFTLPMTGMAAKEGEVTLNMRTAETYGVK